MFRIWKGQIIEIGYLKNNFFFALIVFKFFCIFIVIYVHLKNNFDCLTSENKENGKMCLTEIETENNNNNKSATFRYWSL